MDECIVIGPSKVGKTALISMLYIASTNNNMVNSDYQVEVVPKNDAMAELAKQALTTAREGKLVNTGTSRVVDYRFDLVVKFRSFFKSDKSIHCSLWDGPGGTLFPIKEDMGAGFDYQAHKEFEEMLILRISTAKGVMICIDSSQKSCQNTFALFEHLPSIMFKTGLRRLPAQRIAICLTKADATFNHHKRTAKKEMDKTSPITYASENLLPNNIYGVLRTHFYSYTKVHFNWSAVYGFLPNGGSNLNSSEDGLGITSNNQISAKEAIDNWKPYGILEPFVFLASGLSYPPSVVVSVQNL